MKNIIIVLVVNIDGTCYRFLKSKSTHSTSASCHIAEVEGSRFGIWEGRKEACGEIELMDWSKSVGGKILLSG